MYDVILSPDARNDFANADGPLAKKLARCFRRLRDNPREGNNVKQLKGALAGRWRFRIGDWRVIYCIDEGNSQVLVLPSIIVAAHMSNRRQSACPFLP